MSILSVGYFFATAGFLGITVIQILKLKLGPLMKLTAGFIIGIISLTQIIFWQSWLIPFNQASIMATTGAIILGSGWWWWKNIRQMKIKFNRLAVSQWSFWLAGWIFLWGFIWQYMLTLETDGLYAGWVNIWGDWAAHLSYTTSFAFGQNFPVQMPILIGAKFSYPFLADFLSAILIKLGSDLLPAMLFPSVILSTLLVAVITKLGSEINKNFRAGKLTALLFLFNGGFGWWWWIKDIQVNGLSRVMQNLPREYTHLEKLFNIEWINIITSQVIPQRGFLLGFPAAVLIYFFLWKYWQNKQSRNLLAAGIIISLLPLVHAHSVAIAGAVGATLAAIELVQNRFKASVIKNWFWFAGPLLIIGLPQLLYFFSDSVTNNTFIKWFPGWLATSRGDNFGWFWLKNLGLMAILPLVGLIPADKKFRLFSLPFWLILAAANLWLFQPWEWDNTKFFVHWYLIACVLAGGTLAKMPKIITIILLTITIWAGGLDVLRLTQYPYRKIRFWTNEQLQLADWVKQNTAPGDNFLTADNHDHWLPTLTGRKTLLGFRGWLWTYGINYRRQEQATQTIFQGLPAAREKIKEFSLDYAVIGPMEQTANQDWFEENFPLVYQLGPTRIYHLYP